MQIRVLTEEKALGVTVGNDVARALYVRLGFQRFGIAQRCLKVGGEYFGVEWMVRNTPMNRPSTIE